MNRKGVKDQETGDSDICPLALGIMPPANTCKTVRTVLIEGKTLTGDEACGYWIVLVFFFLFIYNMYLSSQMSPAWFGRG